MSIPFLPFIWYNHYMNMTYNTVIWGILGIAGLLLAISRMGFKKRLDWRIGIGIALFGVSLFVLTTELPQYGIGFSILGMLIMAGAALIAIKQSDEKARIDRRERKLIEIITWANDVARCETAVPPTSFPVVEIPRLVSELGEKGIEAIFRLHAADRKAQLIIRYQSLEAMCRRIALMAKQLDDEVGSSLEPLAQDTCKKLEEHIRLGAGYIIGEISDKEYKECWSSLWRSLVDSAIALAAQAEETI